MSVTGAADNVVQLRPAEDVPLAPTENVVTCLGALRRSMDRASHLPGLVVHYGPSGYGKTFAARYAAQRTDALYVSARSSWTRRALLLAMVEGLGLEPRRTIYELTDQVVAQLDGSRRALVIDEFDHVVSRHAVEVVRDIYDATGVSILLVGEEGLPQALRRWERFHGRVMAWAPAAPATVEDARVLAGLYCQQVQVGEDLLGEIVRVAAGSVRRVVVNLGLIHEEGLRQGVAVMGRKAWRGQLYTGEPPRRRA